GADGYADPVGTRLDWLLRGHRRGVVLDGDEREQALAVLQLLWFLQENIQPGPELGHELRYVGARERLKAQVCPARRRRQQRAARGGVCPGGRQPGGAGGASARSGPAERWRGFPPRSFSSPAPPPPPIARGEMGHASPSPSSPSPPASSAGKPSGCSESSNASA